MEEVGVAEGGGGGGAQGGGAVVVAAVDDVNLRAYIRRLGAFFGRLKYLKKRGEETYPPFRLGTHHESHRREVFGDNTLTTYKYTFLTFLPLVLWDQFHKATNIYFLIMTILTFIPEISPIPGWTALLPFALVLLAAFVKEAFEDYKRHVADAVINNRMYTTIGPDGLPKAVPSKDLKVGDYVVIQQNQEIPADCIVMATSAEDGICYVETAQLDGETNLKRRSPFRLTESLPNEDFATLQGTAQCSNPRHNLDDFSGSLQIEGKGDAQPVDKQNLLIRGTMLRNTTWVVGLVAYVGFKTKLALNSSAPPFKYSALNKMVDRMVTTIIGIKICFCIVAAIVAASFSTETYTYLAISESAAVIGVKAFFSYAILLSYVVPQTLMISLEIAKIIQGRWIDWDVEMALDPQQPKVTGARARSTDQNDELGRVKWIMSDKTGTLTANEMRMMKASVGGVLFEDVTDNGVILREIRRAENRQARLMSEFMFSLAVNHTVEIGEVVVEGESFVRKKNVWQDFSYRVKRALQKTQKRLTLRRKPAVNQELDGIDNIHSNVGAGAAAIGGPSTKPAHKPKSTMLEMDEMRAGKWKDLIYKGSSPDEEAFMKFTLKNGFVYSRRNRENVEVTVEIDPNHPDLHTFTVLHELEYSSQRAMMSVICRDKFGALVVYSKGSDAKMIPLLSTSEEVNQSSMVKTTMSQVDELAAQGLRTLVVTRRTLEPSMYAAWAERLRRATTGKDGTSINDRDAAQKTLYAEVERDLELVGVTAVEDRLQDFVPECIHFFLQAGIRFIMITGDKLGTAETIAKSTNLITRDMTIVRMAGAKNPEDAAAALRDAEELATRAPLMALVVDGDQLHWLLKPVVGLRARFYALLYRSAAVVCCRTGPKQKAKVVELVRTNNEQDITLAIGDGGNDVSMIQKAHIGVGLVGKDGTQAARSSDYALRQFSHLKKLLVVHGRWNYVRNSTMVQYWIYKNVAFIFALFFYGFWCAFSGTNYYDAWVLTLYNVAFTSLPPLFFGFFEQDIKPESAFRYPRAYREVQIGMSFTWTTLLIWIGEAFYVALVCYFFGYGVFLVDILPEGFSYGFRWQGNAVSIYAITVVNLRIFLETRNVTWLIHLAYWISFGLLLLLFGVETVWFSFTPDQFGEFEMMAGSGIFWLLYLLVLVTSLSPAIFWKALSRHIWPRDSELVREQEKQHPQGNPSALREEISRDSSKLIVPSTPDVEDADF